MWKKLNRIYNRINSKYGEDVNDSRCILKNLSRLYISLKEKKSSTIDVTRISPNPVVRSGIVFHIFNSRTYEELSRPYTVAH